MYILDTVQTASTEIMQLHRYVAERDALAGKAKFYIYLLTVNE